MSHITLTDEQTRVLRDADDPVQVRGAGGEILATILPPAVAAIVAEWKQRRESGGPRYPAAEVRARLAKLQELADRGDSLDLDKVKELLARMRAGEEV